MSRLASLGKPGCVLYHGTGFRVVEVVVVVVVVVGFSSSSSVVEVEVARAWSGQQILGTLRPRSVSTPQRYTSCMMKGTALVRGLMRLLIMRVKGGHLL